MAREIERKYLVCGDSWRSDDNGVLYRQGYLKSDPACLVRIRICGEHAFLAVKSLLSGLTRLEYEYPIPRADAEEMLERLCPRPWIEKRRRQVRYGGLIWEIDEFLGDNDGLILAEVELEREDQPVSEPPWAGREVSTDSRYFNVNLARNPYRLWKTNGNPSGETASRTET
ncbi:MAG TPA: CYTH domain-containing protein [Syntrophales bacterium]|nr:CYTH domain-containing protein [Syntrophales bacterium]